MESSETLINRIKEFEGCRLKAYRCPAGVWTIGYGHTKGVREGQVISGAQAESLLRSDLPPIERYVDSLGVCRTQGQFDALVDFAFNLGTGSLERSTLLRHIRAGKAERHIRAEFARWVHSKGRRLPGLVERRAWEADRYFSQS